MRIYLLYMETKQCTTCKDIKSTNDFYFDKHDQRYHSSCKLCCKNRTNKWIKILSESTDPNDILKFTIYKILQSTRSNAKAKHIPCDINLESLTLLYNKQQGKCYYTGTPMSLRSNGHLDRDPLLISLDRLNSNEGYTLTNTVLCCWGSNALKGWHPETMLYNTLKTLYENCHALGKC